MKKQLHVFKKSSIAAAFLFFSLAQTQAQNCATAPAVDVGPATTSFCSGSPALLTGVVGSGAPSTGNTNGFTGPYSVANWTLINNNADGYINVGNAPSSISLTGGNQGGGSGDTFSGDTFYGIIVPATGIMTFNWDYSTGDGASWDYPHITIYGTKTLMTGYDISGSNNQSGTMSVNIVAGEPFGFNMFTVDNGAGAATVSISNFVFSQGQTTSLQWTASNGGVISGASNQLTAVPATSGTYTLTATTGACITSDSIDVTFNTLPTLSTVTAATACAGSRTNIILSGLVPNSVGTATYKVGNGPLTNISVTATANGTFSFQTPVLGPDQNGLVIQVTKIATAAGCETSFTGKKVSLVVIPSPRLTKVTATPACIGGSTNIVLSGLLPNTVGIATVKFGTNTIGVTVTSNASGLFTYATGPLQANLNGTVVEVKKIDFANGCTTNFTNIKVTLVVNSCAKGAISESKGNQDVESTLADLDGQEIKKMTLFPNPTSDILNIQTEAAIETVEIFNLQGQRILTSQQKQINVSQLQAGAYLIRIQDSNNNVISQKFIKK
jgi:hypothetical protein